MKGERRVLFVLLAVFLGAYFLPVESARFRGAVIEALRLARWYAREHVLLCLVPAFFIAGAIGVFVSASAVMRYFGPRANKALSYGVASVSGSILAVCSCTVLPLFGGIYLRGAGLGPAVAFLYSGPAINVLAVVLTARVLGWQLGAARAAGAVVFSVVIGLLMHLLFRRGERARAEGAAGEAPPAGERAPRPLWQTALFFGSMAGVLVFANWASPAGTSGAWYAVYRAKWALASGFAAGTAVCLWRFLGAKPLRVVLAALPAVLLGIAFPAHPAVAFTAGSAALAVLAFSGGGELREWAETSWGFAKQILPLLLAGVLAAGFFLGSPESRDAGILPSAWVSALVGDSPAALWALAGRGTAAVPGWLQGLWPLWTNLFASASGALMYFATLTEVPILRGLLDSGMGQGPALALLLAGPALSLPNLLVLRSILGGRKTAAFAALVVAMATATGMAYGAWMN